MAFTAASILVYFKAKSTSICPSLPLAHSIAVKTARRLAPSKHLAATNSVFVKI